MPGLTWSLQEPGCLGMGSSAPIPSTGDLVLGKNNGLGCSKEALLHLTVALIPPSVVLGSP